MYSTTKNAKTREQIATMVAHAFEGMQLAPHEQAIQELKDGWFNAAYAISLADGREVVLKIAPLPDADVLSYERNIMQTEVATMRLVQQNPAIPVPTIYFFDESLSICDSPYFFMQKIAGDNLEHVRATLEPVIQAKVDQQIGAIIHDINQFSGNYFGYQGNPELRGASWKATFIKLIDALLADGQRKHVELEYSYAEIRAAVLKHAAALDEVTTPYLVHWDAWNANFFVHDAKVVGIIDFERALWGDPLMEAQFRPFSGESLSNVMQGYGKIDFTPAEEQRNQLYSLYLALVMAIECYYRNYDTDVVRTLARQLLTTTMAWLKAH